ncbi:hypothetical protein ILUMI_09733 [Ignelater luminosus]|uniref:Uncharacterized protein n=1 Tax=Ignelater luminosus TaxID=2038154 RepID=A0A8K0D8J4_IGNLU|nr:hypothetical protein ILUMI_09733 [Ignelater luminosus]
MMAPKIITWPVEEKLQDVKNKFQAIGGIENIVGAIDGTFIPIKASKQDAETCITRKYSEDLCRHEYIQEWFGFVVGNDRNNRNIEPECPQIGHRRRDIMCQQLFNGV